MTARQKRQDRAAEAEDLAVFDEPLEQALGALSELCVGIAEDASLHEKLRARADAARTEIDQARGDWYRMCTRCTDLEQETQRLATDLQRLRDIVGGIARSFEDEEWPSGV